MKIRCPRSSGFQEFLQAVESLAVITALALFVIGCGAAHGTMIRSTPLLGRVTMAMSASVLGIAILTNLLNTGRHRNMKLLFVVLATIFAAGSLVTGALGVRGMVAAKQIGWATIGPEVASLGLLLTVGRGWSCIHSICQKQSQLT